MTRLTHLPEPVQPHGGLAAEGALNLLGRPDLDPLVVLMRESAQNSWDAKAAVRVPVQFSVDLRRVKKSERGVLTREIFAELPPRGLGLDGEGGSELSTVLDDPELWLLVISDTGTQGLGGPVRADKPVPEGEPRDFIDLIFNMGQPPDREFGGGTYGFGKTISYLVSQCRTVVTHTVTLHRGRLEHRLIAQAIGHQYAFRSTNYTGRHWWGAGKSHGIEPVTGKTAARLAAALGLPDLEAAGGGTTLAILAPSLEERTPRQAATFMANALTWNFWPKMVPAERRGAAMRFSVTCDGEAISVPDPKSTPPLSAYVEALRAVRECEAGRKTPADYQGSPRVFEIRSQRPKAELGWVALVPTAFRPRRALDEGGTEERQTTAASFTGPSHHVALMRGAELVVRYHPGPELSNPAVEWGGVFKTAQAVDAAFAQAEPPTHDDWRPNLVTQDWYRRYVNVALREIKDRLNGAFGAAGSIPEGEQVSAVMIADALGHLVSSHAGTGASPRRRDRPEGSGSASSPKVAVTRRWFDEADGTPTLNIEFSVAAASGSAATAVEIIATAATAEGRIETEPPAGAAVPRVLGVSQGQRTVEGTTIHVPADDESPIHVVVSQPKAVAVAVDIRPTAEALS